MFGRCEYEWRRIEVKLTLWLLRFKFDFMVFGFLCLNVEPKWLMPGELLFYKFHDQDQLIGPLSLYSWWYLLKTFLFYFIQKNNYISELCALKYGTKMTLRAYMKMEVGRLCICVVCML